MENIHGASAEIVRPRRTNTGARRFAKPLGMQVTQRPDEIPSPHAMMAIAVQAHVSLPTVQRVYAQRPVQQSLYERIRDAIEELGYSIVHPIPPRIRTQHRTVSAAELAAELDEAGK